MRHRVRTISQILPKRKKKDVFNPFDTALPPVVATSIAFIEQNGFFLKFRIIYILEIVNLIGCHKGLYLEGIFRYSSEIKKVKFYLQKFEQGFFYFNYEYYIFQVSLTKFITLLNFSL